MSAARPRFAPLGLISVAVAASVACAPDDTSEPEELGVATSAISVQEAVDSSCSTLSVEGLSLQIIAQANCIEPGAFSEVPDLDNISFSETTFPFLEEPARDALVAALENNPGMQLSINSMLRTVAQQLLLYRWDQNNQCGIGLAATPGNSNHETGLALDTSDYAAWRPALEANGFTWFGSGDTVHFDYTGPGAIDYRGTDVLAFQMLWNKNHPDDVIGEDGEYGPQTENRLLAAPADGFPIGAECAPAGDRPDVTLATSFEDAKDAFLDGPSQGVVDLFEDEATGWTVDVTNQGGGAAAEVVLTIDADSAYFELEDHESRFDLALGPIQPGETKQVSLSLVPILYSVDELAAPSVRIWIAKVDDLYAQSEFGGEVTNVDGSQTFGGGRLELSESADIYSRTHWEWESPRLEGVSGSPGMTFASSSATLDVHGGETGAPILMPPSNLAAARGATVHLRASRTGGTGAAKLLVARDSTELDGAEAIEVPIADDGTPHDATIDVPPGDIRRIAFVPFDGAPGDASIDFIRIEEVEAVGDGDDDDEAGCTCRATARSPEPPLSALWLIAVAAVALGSRRRRRLGPPS